MKKFTNFIESKIVPPMNKIAGNRWLVALKDGFITLIPLLIAGSIGMLMNFIFFDPHSLIGEYAGPETAFYQFSNKWITPIFTGMIDASFGIISIFFLVTYAYSLAKSYKREPLFFALFALGIFFMFKPFVLEDGVLKSYFDTKGLFFSMILTTMVVLLYEFLLKLDLSFKLPGAVPPGVARSLKAIIPAIIVLTVFGLIAAFVKWCLIWTNSSYTTIFAAFYEGVAKPFSSIGNNIGVIILSLFLMSFVFFFGIHSSIIDPINQIIFQPLIVANVAIAAGTMTGDYNDWTILSFNVYAMIGGTGSTLLYVIPMLFLAKSKVKKEITKFGIVPSIFQINEPIIFGSPIMLNPVLFIPFVFGPILAGSFGYLMTYLGFADPIIAFIPWTTPPLVNALLASGLSWKVLVTQIGCIVILALVWLPFVFVDDKVAVKQEILVKQAEVEGVVNKNELQK